MKIFLVLCLFLPVALDLKGGLAKEKESPSRRGEEVLVDLDQKGGGCLDGGQAAVAVCLDVYFSSPPTLINSHFLHGRKHLKGLELRMDRRYSEHTVRVSQLNPVICI